LKIKGDENSIFIGILSHPLILVFNASCIEKRLQNFLDVLKLPFHLFVYFRKPL